MRAVLTLAVVLGSVDAAEACSLPRGGESHHVKVGKQKRVYRTLISERASRLRPAPLVFIWHGWGSSAARIERTIRPDRMWPEAIVVAPQGLPRTFPGLGPTARDGWQIEPGELGGRDAKFFDVMLAQLMETGCVDRKRIYSTGFSNGGIFTNFLGCHRPNIFAAIAPVGGAGPKTTACPRPTPVMITHGTLDRVLEYEYAKKSHRAWQEINGCYAAGEADAHGCQAGAGCNAAVSLCTFKGGHEWPEAATRRIIQFFKRHTR